jgi:hypothetical protein
MATGNTSYSISTVTLGGTTIRTTTSACYRIGTCKRCKRTHRQTGTRTVREERTDRTFLRPHRVTRYTGLVEVVCCGRSVGMVDIRGRKTDHECDERCLSATGPNCECACGGANHGASHG